MPNMMWIRAYAHLTRILFVLLMPLSYELTLSSSSSAVPLSSYSSRIALTRRSDDITLTDITPSTILSAMGANAVPNNDADRSKTISPSPSSSLSLSMLYPSDYAAPHSRLNHDPASIALAPPQSIDKLRPISTNVDDDHINHAFNIASLSSSSSVMNQQSSSSIDTVAPNIVANHAAVGASSSPSSSSVLSNAAAHYSSSSLPMPSSSSNVAPIVESNVKQQQQQHQPMDDDDHMAMGGDINNYDAVDEDDEKDGYVAPQNDAEEQSRLVCDKRRDVVRLKCDDMSSACDQMSTLRTELT